MRIVYSLPDLEAMQRAMQGKPESATYVLQVHVLHRLMKRNHCVSFVGQVNPAEVIFTDNINDLKTSEPKWANQPGFRLIEKISWRVQKLLKIPYLNVFSTIRLFDVCLKEFPGSDVVYERHGLYKTGVARASKRLGIPYIIFFEADDILESDYMEEPIRGLLRWRAKQMMQFNLNAADCIICVSDIGKKHLVNNLGIPASKVLVFPNGVDVDRFAPDAVARSSVRNQLGWANNPIIVFVGNFYQWHDVTTLLNAFKHVVNTNPETRLLLVGDGNTRQEMELFAEKLGLGNFVKFVGLVPHDEVPMYMSAADVGVVPYPRLDREIWFSPLKLYEYMASGTPVVATSVGQITQVIDQKRNGLLVPPEDSNAMADALKLLLDDQALHQSCASQAREEAVSQYSWDQYVSRLENVLSELTSSV
jgi:glycosyltransferase involved in cell wall biosynthesis